MKIISIKVTVVEKCLLVMIIKLFKKIKSANCGNLKKREKDIVLSTTISQSYLI